MTGYDGVSWLDEEAGRLVRPYAISNGRTIPTRELDLLSMVMATGMTGRVQLDREHTQALDLCRVPTPVAEVAARLRLPLMIAKVLLSDLIDAGVATARPPGPGANMENRDLLEVVLNGLRRL
ncbi:MAG TPA: DUF742 domain-containing protein [Streptosporangiaceae bacterium]|jgi:hypothetical protein|nr:DUF742 domain-containing protein [Streptosporangiaceae bacterium]